MSEPIVIEQFLKADTLAMYRTFLRGCSFEDGAVSAGAWARPLKRNKQAAGDQARALGSQLVRSLFDDQRVARSTYPHRAVQPVFNRYDSGDAYGRHEDNPIQSGLRADLSFTLFLSGPDEYEGGALVVGDQPYRLPAGDLLIYDAGTPHEVEPLRSGTRLAAVGWLQSVVRDPSRREMLRSFYRSLDALSGRVDLRDEAFVELNRVRNQLMRMWAEI